MSVIFKTIDRGGELLDDNFLDNIDINSDSKKPFSLKIHIKK